MVQGGVYPPWYREGIYRDIHPGIYLPRVYWGYTPGYTPPGYTGLYYPGIHHLGMYTPYTPPGYVHPVTPWVYPMVHTCHTPGILRGLGGMRRVLSGVDFGNRNDGYSHPRFMNGKQRTDGHEHSAQH